MESTAGEKGPYIENGENWIDTADCLDRFHVKPGCSYEVATGKGGRGTRYSFNTSECMEGPGKPGFDTVGSIRVFNISRLPADVQPFFVPPPPHGHQPTGGGGGGDGSGSGGGGVLPAGVPQVAGTTGQCSVYAYVW